MALAKVYSTIRSDIGTLTSTPYTRGKTLNGYQVEEMVVTKLTGDVTGSIVLSSIRRPAFVYLTVINDSAGTAQASLSQAAVTFTNTNDTTIALSGLGNWTRAIFTILGRSYV